MDLKFVYHCILEMNYRKMTIPIISLSNWPFITLITRPTPIVPKFSFIKGLHNSLNFRISTGYSKFSKKFENFFFLSVPK